MKTGAVLCALIAIGWAGLAIAQLWFTVFTAVIFTKITVTAGLLFIVVLGISLALREYITEQKQKEKGFID